VSSTGVFGATRPTTSLQGRRWALVGRHGRVVLLLMTEEGPRSIALLHDANSGLLLSYAIGGFIVAFDADHASAFTVPEEDAGEEDRELAAEWEAAGMPSFAVAGPRPLPPLLAGVRGARKGRR